MNSYTAAANRRVFTRAKRGMIALFEITSTFHTIDVKRHEVQLYAYVMVRRVNRAGEIVAFRSKDGAETKVDPKRMRCWVIRDPLKSLILWHKLGNREFTSLDEVLAAGAEAISAFGCKEVPAKEPGVWWPYRGP